MGSARPLEKVWLIDNMQVFGDNFYWHRIPWMSTVSISPWRYSNKLQSITRQIVLFCHGNMGSFSFLSKAYCLSDKILVRLFSSINSFYSISGNWCCKNFFPSDIENDKNHLCLPWNNRVIFDFPDLKLLQLPLNCLITTDNC